MKLYKLTARIDGTKILIAGYPTAEPLHGAINSEAAINNWLSTKQEYELKPEFQAEFKALISFDYDNLGYNDPDGLPIESIKHRISITRDCGEGGCAPFGACSNPCKMVAVLLPEVKEETQELNNENYPLIQSDDCDIRPANFGMLLGGNGDYYLIVKESRDGIITANSCRVATSGGKTPLNVRIAISNLYRALNDL